MKEVEKYIRASNFREDISVFTKSGAFDMKTRVPMQFYFPG